MTLGDLFDGAGDQANVVVATGKAGLGMVLDAGRVQMFARAYGLDWDNANGVRRLIIRAGAVRAEALQQLGRGRRRGGGQRPRHPRHRSPDLRPSNMNAGEIVRPEDLEC